MQYIHTSIHIFIKYNSTFSHNCTVFFIIWSQWLRGPLSKLHLICSDRKMLCISCEFLSWKMNQTYCIYNIQSLEKQSHVCTKSSTEMDCDYRRLASRAQVPEKQEKLTTASDVVVFYRGDWKYVWSKWVKGGRRVHTCVLLLIPG